MKTLADIRGDDFERQIHCSYLFMIRTLISVPESITSIPEANASEFLENLKRNVSSLIIVVSEE